MRFKNPLACLPRSGFVQQRLCSGALREARGLRKVRIFCYQMTVLFLIF